MQRKTYDMTNSSKSEVDRKTALQLVEVEQQKQEVRYKLKQTTPSKEPDQAHRTQSDESGP